MTILGGLKKKEGTLIGTTNNKILEPEKSPQIFLNSYAIRDNQFIFENHPYVIFKSIC